MVCFTVKNQANVMKYQTYSSNALLVLTDVCAVVLSPTILTIPGG